MLFSHEHNCALLHTPDRACLKSESKLTRQQHLLEAELSAGTSAYTPRNGGCRRTATCSGQPRLHTANLSSVLNGTPVQTSQDRKMYPWNLHDTRLAWHHQLTDQYAEKCHKVPHLDKSYKWSAADERGRIRLLPNVLGIWSPLVSRKHKQC